MPKLEKNPCWRDPVIVMGSSSNFFPESMKNWKNAKIWVFSISVTYLGCLQMVLGFGPFFLSKKIHFLDKIEKKSKFGDFLEIQKISCIRSLLIMTSFSFWPNLMSYGSFITRDVKLPNFEKVYHGPVVLWRLCLLTVYDWFKPTVLGLYGHKIGYLGKIGRGAFMGWTKLVG